MSDVPQTTSAAEVAEPVLDVPDNGDTVNNDSPSTDDKKFRRDTDHDVRATTGDNILMDDSNVESAKSAKAGKALFSAVPWEEFQVVWKVEQWSSWYKPLEHEQDATKISSYCLREGKMVEPGKYRLEIMGDPNYEYEFIDQEGNRHTIGTGLFGHPGVRSAGYSSDRPTIVFIRYRRP